MATKKKEPEQKPISEQEMNKVSVDTAKAIAEQKKYTVILPENAAGDKNMRLHQRRSLRCPARGSDGSPGKHLSRDREYAHPGPHGEGCSGQAQEDVRTFNVREK